MRFPMASDSNTRVTAAALQKVEEKPRLSANLERDGTYSRRVSRSGAVAQNVVQGPPQTKRLW